MQSIKKALITTGCVISLSASTLLADNTNAKEQSGVFIGADIGFSLGYSSASDKGDGSYASQTTINTNMLYGARLGYQQYFNAYNGLRVYGTFDYTNFTYPGSSPALNMNLFKYSADIDYLLNFSDSENPWGFFIGAGYQWVQSKFLSNEKKQKYIGDKVGLNGVVINAGFSKIINNHNRLELGVKVPVYNYEKQDYVDASETAHLTMRNPVDIYFAYSYSF